MTSNQEQILSPLWVNLGYSTSLIIKHTEERKKERKVALRELIHVMDVMANLLYFFWFNEVLAHLTDDNLNREGCNEFEQFIFDD